MQSEHPLFKTTRVISKPAPKSIFRNEKMIWLGSCFVESMAEYLKLFQYQAVVNPYGVVFHPLVLEKLMNLSFPEFAKTNFERIGVWQNFLLGVPFASESENELNRKIQNAYQLIQEELCAADWLVTTWGTAFWYDHAEFGMVGKCHKFPQTIFQKRLSTVNEIVEVWRNQIIKLRTLNKNLNIILTLSPVRHTRDGLEGNTISKSTLRLAIHQLTEEFDFVFYFPAYEIVMDELRDYRFFEKDMIHPNKEAVAYIWDQFSKQFFDENEQKTNALIQSLQQDEGHTSNVNFGEDFLKLQALKQEKRQLILEKLELELEPKNK